MGSTTVVADLKTYLTADHPGQRVADVRIGLGYTAVMLEDGNVGVAYTFHAEAGGSCSVFSGTRPLVGRPTDDLLQYLGSQDTVESSLGLAVVNAVVNRPAEGHLEGDILDLLEIRSEDRVGMVGYFGPLVAPLDAKAKEVVIFELNAARSDRVLAAEEALRLLPSCEVAIITSTALILGDMDRLLEAAKDCREVALVGASTPLAPEVFRQRGVTLLSGVTVRDAPGILQVVSEGGGMGLFGTRVRKVNIRV